MGSDGKGQTAVGVGKSEVSGRGDKCEGPRREEW